MTLDAILVYVTQSKYSRQRDWRVELHIPSIRCHGFERVVEVIFTLEVVLGGHGLGEVAIDINSR